MHRLNFYRQQDPSLTDPIMVIARALHTFQAVSCAHEQGGSVLHHKAQARVVCRALIQVLQNQDEDDFNNVANWLQSRLY